ncbi:3'-5' exonuclease [Pseudalkalibacillus caeni]|uniref:3'-5' exonuclease n=1 Tax=Exobacillus caeni TaxID=2574798 RepID=A0A5R9F192_9BACL|nr:3'-5' exonuclease [Pseudalkalibacillus caeni]TLS35208.1 3'-5' exonuclease [Pseudalkalibacillus caeni]
METLGFRFLKYFLFDWFRVRKEASEAKQHPAFNRICRLLDKEDNFQASGDAFTVFDLETTGFFPTLGDEIISIGAIKINRTNEEVSESFYRIIRPVRKVPKTVLEITGLSISEIKNGAPFLEVFEDFLEYCNGSTLVAHPAGFDISFLQTMAKRMGLPGFNPPYMDCEELVKQLFPGINPQLDYLIRKFHLTELERHHALNDAHMTGQLFVKLLEILEKGQLDEVKVIEDLTQQNEEIID